MLPIKSTAPIRISSWLLLCGVSALGLFPAQSRAGSPPNPFAGNGSLLPLPTLGTGNLGRGLNLHDLSLSLIKNISVLNLLHSRPKDDLLPSHFTLSEGLETRRYRHFHQGIEVLSSVVLEHLDASGTDLSDELRTFNLDVTPTITQEQALSIASSRLGNQLLDAAPKLKIAPAANDADASARLIYVIRSRPSDTKGGQDIWIDAHTGELAAQLSHEIQIAQNFSVAANAGCQKLQSDGSPGKIEVLKCSPKYGPGHAPGTDAKKEADRDAAEAYLNANKVLTYFSSVHGRNSYDGKGAPVINIVHVGNQYGNAFWSTDLNVMGYGDGNGKTFGHFTRALDVAGHEMTHGITQATAKLDLQDESGAINEAFSDFFGVMIAGQNQWRMGAEVFLANKPGETKRAFRDLANPSTISERVSDPDMGWSFDIVDPSKVSQKIPSIGPCTPENDYCWVHANSTIPGHASYLVAKKLGNVKAQKLYFLTLTHYVSSATRFHTLKKAVGSACAKTLSKEDCASVERIYASLGF